MIKILLYTGLFVIAFLTSTINVGAQARLVINGAVIRINAGANLVIDNPAVGALIRNDSGYIMSEGENNLVTWSVSAGTPGNYVVPFGNPAGYLPLTFSASGGSASGQLVFSTYPTPTYKNSDYLPAGITQVNRNGSDNSAKIIDRFWQLTPIGYSIKPNLSNLSFTYSDGEYNPPNAIIEVNLIAQRWNTSLLSWSDYLPASTINTTSNTITIASLPGSQLYNWWTMVDVNAALPVTLGHFIAVAENDKVITRWQTRTENSSHHFEVWRSRDLLSFDSAGTVLAAGNSTNTLDYSFTDNHPYSGVSYYRLKMVDRDGKFTWSDTVVVNIIGGTMISVYPNPASSEIILRVPSSVLSQKSRVVITDVVGRVVQSTDITASIQHLGIAALHSGVYTITIYTRDRLNQSARFIKE